MLPHYLDLLSEIYRAFDFFNAHFADNKLKCPIIVISPSDGIPMHGWFGVRLWKYDEEEFNEINIGAEYVNRSPEAVMNTLLHEMAHLKNWQEGIVDFDVKTQYHNEQFKASAESFGLVVTNGRAKGYAYTRLGPKALDAIEKLRLRQEVFNKLRRKK